MEFLRPTTLADAVEMKSAHPGAVPIMGGTDVMVEINFDRSRPDALLDLSRVDELGEWQREGNQVRLGSGVSYSTLMKTLGEDLPGLAQASRTVGSPQIRNRGTVGGNLGAASPAGDSHPALLASNAQVELRSPRGVRSVGIDDFYTGVKRNCVEPDELITAILIPAATGPEQFCKIGTRNAMVISVAAFAIALRPGTESLGTGIGSAAPTPRRASRAETFLAAELDVGEFWESKAPLPHETVREFAELVRADALPIDDVRGTAAYRLHALAVMAERALTWAWRDYCRADDGQERKAS